MSREITLTALSLGIQPTIDGRPLYELAESHKHDLEVMMACCKKESESYWSQPAEARFSPAPFYFERAAILCRKAGKYELEVEVCKEWKSMISDYKKQQIVRDGRSVKTHLGPRSKAIISRLPKAKELLLKDAKRQIRLEKK